jgi:hypothetical protein
LFPISAKQVPLTNPTYPVPITVKFILYLGVIGANVTL